jgi:hypothetical protein
MGIHTLQTMREIQPPGQLENDSQSLYHHIPEIETNSHRRQSRRPSEVHPSFEFASPALLFVPCSS